MLNFYTMAQDELEPPPSDIFGGRGNNDGSGSWYTLGKYTLENETKTALPILAYRPFYGT